MTLAALIPQGDGIPIQILGNPQILGNQGRFFGGSLRSAGGRMLSQLSFSPPTDGLHGSEWLGPVESSVPFSDSALPYNILTFVI